MKVTPMVNNAPSGLSKPVRQGHLNVTPVANPNKPGFSGQDSSDQRQSPRERAMALALKGASAPQEAPAAPQLQAAQEVAPKPESSLAEGLQMGARQNLDRQKNDSVEDSLSSSEEPSDSLADAVSKPVTEEIKEDETISSQYANLARKEKALRLKMQQQEQSLKAKEQALAEREAKMQEALKAKEAEYSDKYIPKDRLKSDFINVANELGLTYDQITEMAMNAPTPESRQQMDYIKRLEEKISHLENGFSETRKSLEQQQQEQYSNALKQLERETTKLIESNPEFETIKETGSVKTVVDKIEKTFKEQGILLTVEEAAQEVENDLVEEAMKYARIKKIQSRLQPSLPKTSQEPKITEQEIKEQPTLKTLTNTAAPSRKLSARERALLVARGEKF